MHDFIKKLTVLCTVLCFLIYSAIFVGEKTIPDNITVIENEDFSMSSVLGMNLYSIGYTHVDWNVDSFDSHYNNQSNKIIENTLNCIKTNETNTIYKI